MIIASQSANALSCASGAWRIWSLSDGYLDLPADLIKEPDNRTYRLSESPGPEGSQLRLSVNCFLFDRSDADRVLIDCGAGGSWDQSMGYLATAMAEARIDPASITTLALTHAHRDHIYGLLTRDGGRAAFANLSRIVIAEEAVASFLEQPELARFRPLVTPIKSGAERADHLPDQLRAVAMPGHAPGHMGYLLDTGEDKILFCGDLIHVPAAQFTRPDLTWAYDDDQPVARATRIKLLQDAAQAHAWLAGAHMGRPGIGQIIEQGQGYAFIPVA
jgi:glyoxylase-like metal-dependent hydrolase (beta-lactamase superfamily II)